MKRVTVFAAIALLAASGTAAILSATANPIDSAKPGATIVWPAGDGQTLSIIGKRFDPAITIDASKATFTRIKIHSSRGVNIKGGLVVGPGGLSHGVTIGVSSHISIEGMTITGAHRGIDVGGSEDVILKNNTLTGLISDGINIPLSRRILIEGNTCSDFTPTPAIYDEKGGMVKDGDHADCIQAWTRPSAVPMADIKVLNNRIEGRMHGIFFGSGRTNGVDDGGYDRISIEGNVIKVGSWHGITVGGARGLTVRNNHVSTIPGSMSATKPVQPITAWIKISNSTNVIACGNTVEKARDRTGLERCARR